MTPDKQMVMLKRVNLERERRLAQALAKWDSKLETEKTALNTLISGHKKASKTRLGEISALSKVFGKPHHLWAYTRARDQHAETSTQELIKQHQAHSELQLLGEQRDKAKHAHSKAQRRSAKMDELAVMLAKEKGGDHV